jgi:hypothetical protein
MGGEPRPTSSNFGNLYAGRRLGRLNRDSPPPGIYQNFVLWQRTSGHQSVSADFF